MLWLEHIHDKSNSKDKVAHASIWMTVTYAGSSSG